MPTDTDRQQRIHDMATWSAVNRSGHVIRGLGRELELIRRGYDTETALRQMEQWIADWQDANSAARLAAEEVA